jgi:hypothetical protein
MFTVPDGILPAGGACCTLSLNTTETDSAPLELRPKALMGTTVSSSMIAVAFTSAVFMSAALLFVVEPMFGKMVLPLLGGSPAVWTTCVLFFQGALLLGYLYAHFGPRWLGLRRHIVTHLVLLTLCLLVLPVSVVGVTGTFRFDHPNLWLLWVLIISLGAPFTLLSSTGPLLQVWFAKTSHPRAHYPYFLYAASNLGSLLALLSYPFLIEPAITLGEQARLWSIGFGILIVLVALSAAYLRIRFRADVDVTAPSEETASVTKRTMLQWTVLAFVPSSFFLALTTHLTTDVAAVPLLWIIPLVLYLLSFTMVFGERPILPHGSLVRWQPLGLILLAVLDFWGASALSPSFLPFHLIVFFVTALVCHGELARTKPTASRLTEFYLCLAVGGVLGGVFNAVIAPAYFDSILEYPLTLLLACAVRPRSPQLLKPGDHYLDAGLIVTSAAILLASRLMSSDHIIVAVVLGASILAAVVCLRMSRDPVKFTFAMGAVLFAGYLARESGPGVLLKERNFFGVHEVREDSRHRTHELLHGTTRHGAQSIEPLKRGEPLTYYHRAGPLGDVFKALPMRPEKRAAVIGLGAGALAAYGGKGEDWTFYEIDPDIARIAQDSNYFTYLRDTPARVRVIVGDGRLSILKAPRSQYDLIVLDAFTSDAIPVHLLTAEAMSIYFSRLTPKGVLLIHLSNRFLDLEPVLGRWIQATHRFGLIRVNKRLSPGEIETGETPSIWAAVGRDHSDLGALQADERWRPLRIQEDVALWTDDFSNIFKVFHLKTTLPGSRLGARPDSSGLNPGTN